MAIPYTVPHKDVTVSGKTYRISRLRADEGGWIVVTLTTKMREAREKEAAAAPKSKKKSVAKTPEEVADEPPGLTHEEGMLMTATFLISQLSRTELSEVQTMCLQRVSYEEGITFYPVLIDGTRWTSEELEWDGPAILELTKQVLAFNIAPYFPAPASI
jgi:hypothetical protein